MKTHVVVLASDADGIIYLGEVDRGVRQGVTRLKNAVRFTETGAKRVAKGYNGAWAVSYSNLDVAEQIRSQRLPLT
jgi:hypothetical protein